MCIRFWGGYILTDTGDLVPEQVKPMFEQMTKAIQKMDPGSRGR
jgi:hypothetical protein